MRLKWIWGIASSLALLAMTCGVGVVWAEECAFKDGGYCVAAIAKQVAEKIGVPTEGAIDGVDYLNYYGRIWDQLVKDGKATVQDRDRVFTQAEKAGGTKIGGVNLVVFSAGTLQQLISKNILTKEEAQRILNGAKDGNKK